MFMGTTPYASHISVQRSPNFPPLITSALSPGERKLVTEPTMPPVPVDARMSTSFLVWKSHLRLFFASSSIGINSGERWWITGIAIAVSASGGTGVGPGASKNFLIMAKSLLF